MSYWYCPSCKEEVGNYNVTYQELCDRCGTHVVAVDEAIPADRLQEICEAEADGRLVVLPCKVGDTVYVVGGHIVPVQIHYFSFDDRLFAGAHFDCNDECDGCPFKNWQQDHEGEWDCNNAYGETCIKYDDFGKTVFLSKEAAEAALKTGDK